MDVTIYHTGGIIETSLGSAGAHSIDGSRTKKIPILEPYSVINSVGFVRSSARSDPVLCSSSRVK